MNLHLRDSWWEGTDVCTLCIFTVALWTRPMDSQSAHLWGVCVGVCVCQPFEHHPKRCFLAVHKPPWQHKSKQPGNFFKSAFWTCAVALRLLHLVRWGASFSVELITPFSLIIDSYYCGSEGWMHIQNSPLRSPSCVWHVCLWHRL